MDAIRRADAWTLTISSATASSGTSDITRGGQSRIPRQPDIMQRQLHGSGQRRQGTATRAISVTVTAVPDTLDTPTGLAWDTTTPGKATWSEVTDVSSYSVQLYKDASAQGSAVSVAAGTLNHDFTSAIEAAGNGFIPLR